MPKSYEQFRYRDWEWIAIHFLPAEREDMARTAWLIAQCSADEIAKHQNLDPRIIISLCAVEFQDYINWEELKKINFDSPKPFVDDLDDDGVTANFRYIQHLKQQQSQNYFYTQKSLNLANKISYSQVWQNLFLSLEQRLQLDLLKCLQISTRRLSKNDWRNIYEEKTKYSFQTSFCYRFILLCVIALIVFSFIVINSITLKENLFWINILKGLVLYILITFWISSLQNSTYFIKYGLLGLLPFKSNISQWLSTKRIESIVDILNTRTEIVSGFLIVFLASVMNGASMWVLGIVAIGVGLMSFFGKFQWSWFIYLLIFMFVIYLIPVTFNIGAIVVAVITIALLSVAFGQYRAAIGAIGMSIAFYIGTVIFGFFPVTEDGFIFGIFIGFLLALVRLISHKYTNYKNYLRLLSIITFPLFCSFPILVSFATIFLLRYFSWQNTLFIWLISLGICTGLWLYGQDKERKATNPLKGIL